MTDDSCPKLVFIHGAGGTHRVWRYQSSAFPESLTLDLPGHPSGQGRNTVSGYAEFVLERIAEQEMNSVVLIGHSMGGAITIEIALSRPPFLSGIALVGSGARLRVTPVIFEELLHDYAHAAEIIVDLAYSTKSSAKLRRASVQELLEVPVAVTYGDFEACDRFDRMNDIDRITVPTLIVCGRDDRLTPVKYSQYMKDRLRNARLVIIPDAGHSIMLEKPEEVNAAIHSFISDLKKP